MALPTGPPCAVNHSRRTVKLLKTFPYPGSSKPKNLLELIQAINTSPEDFGTWLNTIGEHILGLQRRLEESNYRARAFRDNADQARANKKVAEDLTRQVLRTRDAAIRE